MLRSVRLRSPKPRTPKNLQSQDARNAEPRYPVLGSRLPKACVALSKPTTPKSPRPRPTSNSTCKIRILLHRWGPRVCFDIFCWFLSGYLFGVFRSIPLQNLQKSKGWRQLRMYARSFDNGSSDTLNIDSGSPYILNTRSHVESPVHHIS